MYQAFADATCTLNGQIVSCAQMAHDAKEFLGWGFGFFLFFIVLFLLMFIFWIMMIVHAIRNPIEHKPLWILIMLLTGIIGAIIYYFAVKKDFTMPASPAVPPQTPPSYGPPRVPPPPPANPAIPS